MGIAVKICGVTTVAAADAAIARGADYLGLVFHPACPRNLALEQASALAAHARGRIRLVALSSIRRRGRRRGRRAAVPDFLPASRPRRRRPGRAKFVQILALPVIKALPVAEVADLAIVPIYDEAADMFLFDAKAPAGADRPGGHGAAFDWQLMAGRQVSAALAPGRRARCGECRPRHRDGRGAGRRCVVRRGKRAGHQGCADDRAHSSRRRAMRAMRAQTTEKSA